MAGDEDSEDKQFEATQHKLREQRKKGNVFKSKDLTQLSVMIIGFVMLFVFGNQVFRLIKELCYLMWGNIPNFKDTSGMFINYHTWRVLILIIVPTMVLLAGVALVMEVLQLGGVMFTMEPLKFKLEKLDPIKGLKNMFNVKSLFELVKGLIKVLVTGYIAWTVVDAHMPQILGLIQADNKLTSFFVVSAILWEFFWKTTLLLFVVSIIDYIFQRWKFMKEQRMSFKEMKDEYKDTEGDPLIKSKRRQKQREIARGGGGGGMAKVPEADFVVKNPTHVALAVQYDENMDEAPKVIAKGADLLAEQIIAIAEAYGIPVVENIPLSRALFRLVRVNQQIPPDLYRAVAEVLLFVYKVKGKGFN
ncbi:MAG: EscU/YscU/HrcU family type III secretion system export apparatus switch protein [Candidatus Caenarcaniphilales bacterium]|nr:EscU/YscU/HrcU family type III secretion system export apparatus switch protein [Candidatus Caenarcaniphilales bacterium]